MEEFALHDCLHVCYSHVHLKFLVDNLPNFRSMVISKFCLEQHVDRDIYIHLNAMNSTKMTSVVMKRSMGCCGGVVPMTIDGKEAPGIVGTLLPCDKKDGFLRDDVLVLRFSVKLFGISLATRIC